MPYKQFNVGDEALASDVNTYLMGQTVMRFANAAARDAALTSPTVGQVVSLDDSAGLLWVYRAGAWNPQGFQPRAVNRLMSGTNTFTNPTSFTFFPNSADRTALQLSFTKMLSTTRLIVSAQCDFIFSAGVSQALFLGLFIAGAWRTVATRAVPQQVIDYGLNGHLEITGVAAGTYTIEPGLASGGGSQIIMNVNSQGCSYRIEEAR